MKKLLFVLATAALLFTACSKDDEMLDRDKFLGSYTGTISTHMTMDGEDLINQQSAAVETITKAANASEVLIGASGDTQLRAIASGNTLTIPEQTIYSDLGDGTALEFAISGTAVLSGERALTLTLFGEAIYQGQDVYVTILEALNKN